MPTYDYKCKDCGYKFEYFQSMTDDHLKDCPKCGGSLKRLIGSGAGPIFKGNGYYQTDYKPKPKESSATTTESKKTETASTATESKTSDTKKPAA